MTMDSENKAFPEQQFTGKSVVISGGTSGIGLAIAEGFSRAGATVVASGSSAAKIAECQANADYAAIDFRLLDVRSNEDVKSFFAGFSSLNVLVNCQGVARPDAEWDEETFLDVMDINLSSAMRLSRAAFPLLKISGGSIINFASMLSFLADETVPAYTASKTGIVGFDPGSCSQIWPRRCPGQRNRPRLSQDRDDPGALVCSRQRAKNRRTLRPETLGNNSRPHRPHTVSSPPPPPNLSPV